MSDGPGPGHDGPDGPDDPADIDAAWDDIIANYGERAEVEPGAEPAATNAQPAPAPSGGEPEEFEDAWWAREEHFVPPTPPPAPLPEGAKGAAWLGVLGSPVAMLVLVFLRITIPTWLGLLLFAAFVGGIVYLIAKMPRGDDDDPFSGDDGAVV